MSTNNLDDSNPIGLMLIFGAGSLLGSVLSQVLFAAEKCPVPEKSVEENQIKTTETNTTGTDEPITRSNQSEIAQES